MCSWFSLILKKSIIEIYSMGISIEWRGLLLIFICLFISFEKILLYFFCCYSFSNVYERTILGLHVQFPWNSHEKNKYFILSILFYNFFVLKKNLYRNEQFDLFIQIKIYVRLWLIIYYNFFSLVCYLLRINSTV